MSGIKIVSQIEIDGVWVNQDELDPALVRKMVESTIDKAMKNIGAERIRTA